jgi:hypothetical protein
MFFLELKVLHIKNVGAFFSTRFDSQVKENPTTTRFVIAREPQPVS